MDNIKNDNRKALPKYLLVLLACLVVLKWQCY